jgi:hypothetical protein
MSWKALVIYSPRGVSKLTIQCVLRRYHLKKWKSKKRIPLKCEIVKEQYKFAYMWLDFPHWEEVLFSNECSV